MGPVYYTVERLSGDYAFLRSDEGSRVKWENFEYFML